ncbi:MAG: UbiA prenyltransferase family protein [Patescibacteria group bacterium]
MDQTIREIIISSRPRQWLKNISLFTGLVFTGWLFIPEKFWTVVEAFFIFSFITSAVYILNDVIDAPNDRMHPLKKNRPIAAGRLPIPIALFAVVVFTATALWFAYGLSFFFFMLSFIYILLHFAYSLWLKHITILDVMAIASGFILRVYAGAVVIDAHINVWLLLCIVSFSLFLAVGKRRSERTLLKAKEHQNYRQVLTHYPESLLTIYTAMFATTTWLTYALFSFQHPAFIKTGPVLSLMSDLPRAFVNQKLLMLTVPLVIYGVMRYLQLIYDQDKGESPEEVLLSDKPLLGAVFLWGTLLVFILYGIN